MAPVVCATGGETENNFRNKKTSTNSNKKTGHNSNLDESLEKVQWCLPSNKEFLGAFMVARKLGNKWLVAIQRDNSSENL